MSDHPRLSSPPASSSPGRLPPIARPDWPWAAHSYSSRSQQNSPHPASSVQGSNFQSGWDSRLSISSGTPSGYSGTSQSRNSTSTTPKPLVGTSKMGISSGESTRQWTFTGFEWAVRDVHKLRDFVEGIEPAGILEDGTRPPAPASEDFEILNQSPMLGDHRFKLEIELNVSAEGVPLSTPTTLRLFITSLMLDFSQGDYDIPASMMAAIKCQDDRVGERGARPDWVWEFWQSDWVFRRESEVWECQLPSVSSLLENSRIRETDSMVICVQIHCPAGPFIPQQPSVYYVPRDLLDGLEASLDNASEERRIDTGDVRFVCLEKYTTSAESPLLISSFSTSSALSGGTSPFGSHATARKRIIYAHSDILMRRSEYFATMLSSSFAENATISTGERKFYTIVVEEADFVTIYWLLKYCYANWLLFKETDDPRAAVEGVGAGWNARWLNGKQGEWDWKTFHKGGHSDDDTVDNRSAASGDSLPVSTAVSRSTSRKSDTYHPIPTPAVPSAGVATRPSPTKSTVNSAGNQRPLQTSSSSSRRAVVPNPVAMSAGHGRTSDIQRTKPVSPSTGFPPSSQYPVSPRASRQTIAMTSVPDPHPHPTPAPGPASALSVYQVAHRYTMHSLSALALEHIMSTITPQSSFALLLATSSWDELHTLIEDYVVEKWDEVSVSAEFEQCCKEVAAGEWGPAGGTTLMSVFRRLRSPATIA